MGIGEKMARKDESVLNLLVRLPWWVSLALAVGVLVLSEFVAPLFSFENPVIGAMWHAGQRIGPLLAIILAIVSVGSTIVSWRTSRMLETQKGLDTVGKLGWQDFESLVGEIFKRKGYFILENPGTGPDEGVDLRLRRDGKKVYVQCKHWKAKQVGVKIVRELYGVMTAKSAEEGIVVTSGSFSKEASDFARGKSISLIDGKELAGLIEEVQKNPKVTPSREDKKICPKCGSEMVLRTARKGKYAGQKFWGCSNFPKCRTVVNMFEDEIELTPSLR
jgi:restriction system protein